MPENLRAAEFVKEAWEDFNSPTTSNFLAKLAGCRSTVAALEEVGVAVPHQCTSLHSKQYNDYSDFIS